MINKRATLRLQLLDSFKDFKHQKKGITLRLLKFKDKKTIYGQDNQVQGAYFIISGKIKCFHNAGDGMMSIVSIKTEYDFFGYRETLLGRKSHSNTAIAWGEVSLFFIPNEVFKEVLKRNHNMARAFTEMLCEDLLETEDNMAAFRQKQVKRKLAHILLWMNSYFTGSKMTEGIPVSLIELASMIGVAAETVSRMMTAFKQKKIISSSGQKIIILDKKKLQNELKRGKK